MPDLRIAHISTYSPTQCGIATYTEDLISSMSGPPAAKIRLSYGDTSLEGCDYTLPIANEDAYDRAAEFINASTSNVVSLQHEFGIYGGDRGCRVIRLLRGIRKPIVTTLHTVKRTMSEQKREILLQIAAASRQVIVLTRESAAYLTGELGISPSRVTIIPHGIPEVPFRTPASVELRQRLNASLIFISAGHRRRTKGYHLALEALARYSRINSDFKYLVIGTHQPQFQGFPGYGEDLRELCRALGLEKQVVWIDAYVERSELLEYVTASDIGLVTYTAEGQNASGILPLFLGCGRVVIATTFECSRSLEREASGLFLAPDSIDGLVDTITAVAGDEENRARLMAATYDETRRWLWKTTGQEYRRAFFDALTCRDELGDPEAESSLQAQ